MGITFIGTIGFIVFAVATVAFGYSAYYILSARHLKRPEVPWSQVHPLAKWNHGFIISRPQYLTEEGQRRLRRGVALLLIVAVMAVVSIILRWVESHAL